MAQLGCVKKSSVTAGRESIQRKKLSYLHTYTYNVYMQHKFVILMIML